MNPGASLLVGFDDEAAWGCAAARSGYAWWYADVAGDDYALSVILLAGAVFSPRYAARVRAGHGDTGLDHPAVHLALYRRRRAGQDHEQLAWVMNEHPREALERLPAGVRVGGSSLRAGADGTVTLELAEETTRFFGRAGAKLRGRIVLGPGAPPHAPPPVRLSAPGGEGHFWQPLRPLCPAQVELQLGEEPIRFTGEAYHDRNFGQGRLERAFARWSWAHGSVNGDALVMYRAEWRGGGGREVAVGKGRVETAGLQGAQGTEDRAGPGFLWLKVPAGFSACGLRCERAPGGALSDTPFYARYRARLSGDGGDAHPGIGEYLDLERFGSRGIQFLLRFKTRVL